MTEWAAKRRMTLIAGITSLIGPTCAALSETGHLELFQSVNGALLELLVLAIIGAFGVGIGAFAIWRGAKVAGIVCFLTNGAVLALYGFIAGFFFLGGGR